MTRCLTALAACLAHLARGWGPSARRRERQARAAIGMPARHPERITAELSARQEEQLAALCAELWPHDEYVSIITTTHKEENP